MARSGDRDTGRRRSTEMRRLLGVLRDEAPTADAGPQPGHGVASRGSSRSAVGCRPRVDRRPARPLRARRGVPSTALVQEALTNSSSTPARSPGRRRAALGDGADELVVRDDGAARAGRRCRAATAWSACASGRDARRLARRPARARWRLRCPPRLPRHAGVSARVFLVDDQELVRAGFRCWSGAGTSKSWARPRTGEGLEALAVHVRDVVLMDVRMPGLDGIAGDRGWIAASGDGPRRGSSCSPRSTSTSTCSPRCAPARAASCSRTPAGGALGGDPRGAGGEPSSRRAPPAACSSTSPARCPRDRDDPRLEALTPREREVLLAVARGLSNAEIAGELFMSEATVKTHVGRLLAKLEQRDRVQLVVFAYENGLVKTNKPQVVLGSRPSGRMERGRPRGTTMRGMTALPPHRHTAPLPARPARRLRLGQYAASLGDRLRRRRARLPGPRRHRRARAAPSRTRRRSTRPACSRASVLLARRHRRARASSGPWGLRLPRWLRRSRPALARLGVRDGATRSPAT